MRGFVLACGLVALAASAVSVGAANANNITNTTNTTNIPRTSHATHTVDAQPLRIDGISAFAPLPAAAVTPLISSHEMQVRWPGGRLLRVTPWPSFLPQHFSRQTVDASRTLFPSGPADRVSFTRIGEKQPWLVVGTGARSASRLIGGWHLQRAGAGWVVADDSRVKHWSSAAPASVSIGRERWCLYLLDTGVPHARAGIATEGEAQVAWAAQKLGARRQSCPAQR